MDTIDPGHFIPVPPPVSSIHRASRRAEHLAAAAVILASIALVMSAVSLVAGAL